MEQPSEQFPSGNEDRENAIIDALTEGDVEFLEDLGGDIIEGKSKEEVLRGQAHGERVEALIEEVKSAASNEELDPETRDRAKTVLEKLKEGRIEEGKEHFKNIPEGTPQEVFYRIISEEYPRFQVEIEEAGTTVEGEDLEDTLGVKATPFENERKLLTKILQSPDLKVLLSELISRPDIKGLGERLEKEDMLPQGTTDRLLAYWYKKAMEQAKDEGSKQRYEDRIEELGVEPLSGQELRDLIKERIDREMEKKSGI